MAYATPALIRSLEQAFSDTGDYPDLLLAGWSTDVAEPEINARLLAAGYAAPITTAIPALIALIAAQLSAAHGLDSYLGQFTGNPVARAQTLREEARGLLDKIADGTLEIAGKVPSAEGRAIIMDPDPETMHDKAAVVGKSVV